METRTALVGIGANLGDPAGQVRRAMDALAALASPAGTLRRSGLWASRPVDCPPGSPDFVNAVVALPLAAGTEPRALLESLQRLEARAGRVRTIRNAPRLLDLDLLLVGETRLASPELVLPHPRAQERAFVLLPAAEVAPALRWPGDGRTVAELAAAVPGRETLRRLA